MPNHPSSYRGVTWINGRWKVEIRGGGFRQYLGCFAAEEAAAQAYDEKAKQVFDIPTLNFLPDGSLNPDRKLKYVE